MDMNNLGVSILIFLLIVGISGLNKCAQYRCENLNKGITDVNKFKCSTRQITQNQVVFKMERCPSNFQCVDPFGNEDGQCQSVFTQHNLYPGEVCQRNQQCISSSCVQNKTAGTSICKGLNETSACQYDSECDIGLACVAQQCKKWVSVVGYPCGLAPSQAKCASWLTCANGKCQNPGAIAVGHHSDSQLACVTMFNYRGEGETNYTCTYGPMLVGKGGDKPLQCSNPRDKCNYSIKYGGKEITLANTDCECGKNPKGYAYCPLGKGNMVDGIKTVRNNFNN